MRYVSRLRPFSVLFAVVAALSLSFCNPPSTSNEKSSETKADAAIEKSPDSLSENTTDAKPDGTTEATTEAKPDGTTEAKPEATAEAKPDAVAEGTPDTTLVDYKVTVSDYITRLPLSNGKICLAGTLNCAATNATGEATIKLPMNVEHLLKAEAPSYLTVNLPVGKLTANQSVVLTLLQSATVGLLAGQLGVTVQPGSGFVFVVVTGSKKSGASFEVAPTSGDGPYYSNAQGFPDPTLRVTSVAGAGILVNVGAANYDLTLFPSVGSACTTGTGWLSSPSKNRLKLQVVADEATAVAFDCN